MQPWAASLSCWQQHLQQGAWNKMVFKVPSNVSHSVFDKQLPLAKSDAKILVLATELSM